tara:strand:- start:2770 stop:3693 length:924 start_codon:yes stop_codon:yes gene_type:complete
MKIYINNLNENWVVDNVISEWKHFNSKITTDNIKQADIIWLIAPWTWKKVRKKRLKNKKVICTIHHIDFDKFNDKEKTDFFRRDKYVNTYHTVSYKTKKQLETLTNKDIFVIPFWINQENFYEINNKDSLREKYRINKSSFVVGSFQRDTEGSDLVSPKLSKGPDRFLNIILEMKKENSELEVLLTGKRRGYLIENFKIHNIPFHYFEMVDYEKLNELYNLLDLYIVASRVEGGPRSLFECAITRTPIISTDVGFASELLSSSSIFEVEKFSLAKPDVEYSRKKVLKYKIPDGFEPFLNMFKEIYEN